MEQVARFRVERTLCANTFLKFFVVVFSDAESSFKGIQTPAYHRPGHETTGCGRETASETAVPATRETREPRARCVRRANPSQVLDTLVSCIRVAPDTHKKVM